MKKAIILFLGMATLAACKNTGKSGEGDGDLVEVRGDFIYFDDAAVLKGRDFIYGVAVDELCLELAEKVEPAKENEYDMVPVTLKGVVNPKPEGTDGWEEVLTIKEIVFVSSVPSKEDIRIQSEVEEVVEEEI